MGRPDYFCCAIPMVNAGIYSCMGEQFIIGMAAGVLAVATPSITGGYVPTYTPYIFAALSFLVAVIQLIGFLGVFKERIRLFKTYAWMSTLAFISIFAIAAALIIVSALRHDRAVEVCQAVYFSAGNTTTSGSSNSIAANSATTGESETICSAFAWADVGFMAGLWFVLAILQGYMLYMTHSYSIEQKDDHEKYKSIYSANAEEYAMFERMSRFGGPNPDAWDHRPSLDSMAEREHADALAYQQEQGYEYDQVPAHHQGPGEGIYDAKYDEAADQYGAGSGTGSGAGGLAQGRANPFARPPQGHEHGQEHEHEQERYRDAGSYHPPGQEEYLDSQQTPRGDHQHFQQEQQEQYDHQYYAQQNAAQGGVGR